jgi:RNA ligase (TIGR02306 family)
MSTFAVRVLKIRKIHPIPGADAIEMIQVGDYLSVVKKNSFQENDLCVYIPEAALVPQELLKEIGLEGKLAGSEKNRVKAIRLRGCLSQGICIPTRSGDGWVEGQDVAGELGITKYEPPIPAHLQGQVFNLGRQWTFHYDIENFKAFPDVLVEGEQVVMTEKVHGTWTVMGMVPRDEPTVLVDDQGYFRSKTHLLAVSSKGLFAQGLAFKDVPENFQNLYVRVARHLGIEKRIEAVYSALLTAGEPVYVLGETFGVQDLKYGASTNRDDTIGFRVFDIFVGQPAVGRFLDDAELDEACAKLGLERVPVLYRGSFSRAAMLGVTDGKETLSGMALHVREGTVVKPVFERFYNGLPMNRVQLKSVSGDYLTRKGNKGEEPTELE